MSDSPWKTLNEALELNIIEYFDLELASYILNERTEENEPLAALICHLSLCTRAGHLCLNLEGNDIRPSPSIIWQGFKPIQTLITRSFKAPPILHKALIYENQSLYLNAFWNYEEKIVSIMSKHEGLQPSVAINSELYAKTVDHWLQQSQLQPEQANAIKKAAHHTITFISGGPGTGKTYTAGKLIEAILGSLSLELQEKFSIALAAPTGKAAYHLLQSIQNGLSNPNMKIQASTLHGLLGLPGKPQKLRFDLVLIDESSMIDAKMMFQLLENIKPGSRLIFLGDHHQLPPVEAGAPFFDFIGYREGLEEPSRHPAHLNKCMRSELKTIIDFAATINSGNVKQLYSLMSDADNVIRGKLLPSQDRFRKSIAALAENFPLVENLAEASLKSFRILTPLRKGPWGTDSLNKALHEHYIKRFKNPSKAVIPILILSNDHQLELFNGESGFLQGDKAYFPNQDANSTSGNQWREFDAAILPKYEYGYCLSVYKSQGSEFDNVLIIIPEYCEEMGKAMLYTAATRARKSLELWYEPKTLEKLMAHDKIRLSNIVEKLQAKLNPIILCK